MAADRVWGWAVFKVWAGVGWPIDACISLRLVIYKSYKSMESCKFIYC